MTRILLDVDGVVADFTKGVEDATNHKFSKEDLKVWDILDKLDPEKKEHALEVLTEPEFWRNLPIIDGAQEVVNSWDSLGHDITWVTSPWVSCESWESARRDWLDMHFGLGTKGHHYIPTSSKGKIVGDVFIDDKPKNVTEWMAAHPQGKAFIFDAPHNQSFHGAPRFTWKRARDLV